MLYSRIRSVVLIVVLLFSINIHAQTISDSLVNYGIEVKVPATKYFWGWSQAIFLQAVIKKYEVANSDEKSKYFDYIKTAMDINLAKANGRTPNDIASGVGMAFLARVTKEEKYKQKALAIYEDYKQIIKASNGGVSHRANIAQLWDDTIYMLSLYLFEMYKLTGDEKYLDDFMQQYTIHKQVLQDKQTGFWVHGWNAENREYDDSCCMIGWDKNPERKNHEFWGRGNGWIMMTIADAITVMPKGTTNWKLLKNDLINMTINLPALQNKETGHWYQLPIHPTDSLNYQESSCTAMFGYSILVGIKQHLLSANKFMPVVKKAFKGLSAISMRNEGNKYLVPTRICIGTCIGDRNYYYHRRIVEGNDFGIGLFTMFTQKYEQVK